MSSHHRFNDQFRETSAEKNARLKAARLKRATESPAEPTAASPQSSAAPISDEQIAVEMVECVSYEKGYEEDADPIWRIIIDGYCADFPSEGAATNFRNAIASAIRKAKAAVEAERDAYVEAALYDAMMSGPVFKGWNQSQLNRARKITEERRNAGD